MPVHDAPGSSHKMCLIVVVAFICSGTYACSSEYDLSDSILPDCIRCTGLNTPSHVRVNRYSMWMIAACAVYLVMKNIWDYTTTPLVPLPQSIGLNLHLFY